MTCELIFIVKSEGVLKAVMNTWKVVSTQKQCYIRDAVTTVHYQEVVYCLSNAMTLDAFEGNLIIKFS